jgi:hypothetical protein
MNEDRQKILDRILKLLALAQGTSFDAEAATARRMAEELLIKHNVDLRVEGKPARNEFTFQNYDPWGKQWLWEWIIATAVAHLCGCEPYYRGEHPDAHHPDRQYSGFMFAGRIANVEACLYVLSVVHRQRQAAWLRYKGEGGVDGFGKFCFSFARGLEEKIQQLITAAIAKEKTQAKLWYESTHAVSVGEAIRGRGSSDAGRAAGAGASLHRGEVSPTNRPRIGR